jgi:cytochrome c-type biogenesis protein CcmF
MRAIRRNFVLPCVALLITAVTLIATGVRPWKDDDPTASIYALVCFSLSIGVLTAIVAEFLRGASVVSTQTGKNLVSAVVLLTRRNTRRYGGYLVHFGIVALFIGLAGAAFNQSKEIEMGFGDSVQLGSLRIVCQSYSQDSNANYDTDFAILDVYRGDKHLVQLTPERRFYTASQQTDTVVAIHSNLARDLYVIFMGRNPQTDRPILKVFINPLVNWIWIGAGIIIFGTFIALVPPLVPGTKRVEATEPVRSAPPLPNALPSFRQAADAPEAGHA